MIAEKIDELNSTVLDVMPSESKSHSGEASGACEEFCDMPPKPSLDAPLIIPPIDQNDRLQGYRNFRL